MFALLLIAASVLPQPDGVLRESCDLTEINSLYDCEGRLVFVQSIWWDWDGDGYQVRAWRLVKHPSQLPQRDWAGGGYSAMWQDGEQIRHIHSRWIRETWTQYDPELLARTELPQEMRRGLRGQ